MLLFAGNSLGNYLMADAGGAGTGAFKVNSLSGLDRANAVEGEVVWDAPRSLWNCSMLASALILGPLFFRWSAFSIFLITAAITLCAGHSVGFHRRLIHRNMPQMARARSCLVWDGSRHGRSYLDHPFA